MAPRAALLKSGCLDPAPVQMKRIRSREDSENPRMDWLTDPGAIQAGLLSEAPGLALFSLRRMGKKGAALLQSWSRQASLREICALGLGMMGLPEALPQLRKMAFSRGDLYTVSSALCLLRRLGERSDLPALRTLAEQGGFSASYAGAAIRSIESRESSEKGGGF